MKVTVGFFICADINMVENGDRPLAGKVSDIISRFFKSKFDQEPSRIMVLLQEDMIIVRTKGIISKAEQELARTKEGRELTNRIYYELFEKAHPLLKRMLKTSLGLEVASIHTEINFKTAEVIQLINLADIKNMNPDS